MQRTDLSASVRHVRTRTTGGVISARFEYVHRDHLGSVDVVTSAAGAILNDKLSFDPRLGRFVSPDPIVQALHFSQSYNRYAYVFNNPLSYTDPSGYAVEPQHVVSFAVTAIASGLGVPPPVAALIGAFVGALFGGDTGSASTGTGAATGGGLASGGSRGASGGGAGGNSKDGSPARSSTASQQPQGDTSWAGVARPSASACPSSGTLNCGSVGIPGMPEAEFSGIRRVKVQGLLFGTNVEKLGRFRCRCEIDGETAGPTREFYAPGGGYTNLFGISERQTGYRTRRDRFGNVLSVDPKYEQINEGFEVDLDRMLDRMIYRNIIRGYETNNQDYEYFGPSR